jgi:two-component system OmpR family sensor kinase
MSLRTRLLIALLAAVFAALVVVDVLTYTLVSRAQLDQVDQDLERAHPPIERAGADDDDRGQAIAAAAPGFYVELRDANGTSLLAVPLFEPGEAPQTLTGVDLPNPSGAASDDDAVFATVDLPDGELLRVRVSRQDDGNTLVIGRPLEPIEDTQRHLLWVLLASTAGVLAAVGLAGTRLVNIGLRPLTAVDTAASGISDSDLHRRVPVESSATEVGRLATTINMMLERLEAAFVQRESDVAALQESEARMRRFVADASHELRTPIAATAAYAELFDRGARDHPDDLERAMSGIRSETRRMAALVEDLLLLAQLDEGRPLERRPVDLVDVVVDAVDAARAVAEDHPVHLHIADAARVIGDELRLRQVVDNLLANVRTHTPTGTSCTLELANGDGNVTITMSDDGPGMDPADAARAFDRFHRADSSRTRASGGTGLGLAIVAAIVNAHHGEVTMHSDIGRGTTVTIRLPRAPDNDETSE